MGFTQKHPALAGTFSERTSRLASLVVKPVTANDLLTIRSVCPQQKTCFHNVLYCKSTELDIFFVGKAFESEGWVLAGDQQGQVTSAV